LTQ
jgi:hypothetical protein